MREWTDETTGRTVRQLTDLPEGASVSYFRMPRHVPGGWILAWGKHARGHALLLDPDSGDALPLEFPIGGYLKLNEATGRLWYTQGQGRAIWAVDLPGGTPTRVGEVPAEAPGSLVDITCDGRTAILAERTQDLTAFPIPTTKDVAAFWHYISRPRSGRIWACDLPSGRLTKIAESTELCIDHVDTSPTDSTLLKFCKDMLESLGQRMYTVRVDGAGLRQVRHQEMFEMITHEFWWPGGQHIGYTDQDRRGDPTFYERPWCEYAPVATRLGIAALDGREVYLSDPLNCYHSHLFVSPDGAWVCGEGTDGHSFAYCSPFSWKSTAVNFVPMATIHTPYVPFRGQGVETGFSADSRWLLFNDTLDGRRLVCSVRVEG